MTLYEIDAAIRDLIENAVDPETGEIAEDLSLQLEELGMAREAKLENIACYIKDLKAEAEAIRAEERNLATRRRTTENKAARLTDYLSWALAGEKFKTPRCAVSFRKSMAVQVNALMDIPEEYLRFKDPEPDKAKIKDALKEGLDVPGAELVENVSVIIK